MSDRIVTKVIVPPPLLISDQHSKLFTDAIVDAMSRLSWKELIDIYWIDDDNLIISFDGDYKPFIGKTRGFNRFNERVYFDGNNDVISNIADALDATGRDINGGRVFINRRCAYYYNGICRQAFITFGWQSRNDPVKVIQAKYHELLMKSIQSSPILMALASSVE